jgi:hypothetical protein
LRHKAGRFALGAREKYAGKEKRRRLQKTVGGAGTADF